MKTAYLILFSLLLIVGQACAPINVLNAEAESGFALTNYKTFDFYTDDAASQNASPEYLRQIDFTRAEVKNQLESMGLRHHMNSTPDLKVNIGMVVEDKTQTRQTNITTDPPRYTGQRRYQWKSKEVEVGKYKAGTLSLHLVDVSTNHLVWKGEAETIMPKDSEDVQERIAESVQALFKRLGNK